MNKNILLAAIFITIVPFTFADPPGWTIKAVGTIADCQELEMSDTNIVWIDVGENSNEVFFYDGEKDNVTQITNNNLDEAQVKISDTYIVWQYHDGNDFEIALYNHKDQAITQLTDNNLSDSWPRISGNNIVWQGYDGTDWEIFIYDGNDITQLTDNIWGDYKPDVSGTNVTWHANPNSEDYEIFFYDGLEILQLTDNVHNDELPRISGPNIAWRRYDGNDYEIFYFNKDSNSITQLTDNDISEGNPQISDTCLLWTCGSESNLYDGQSITPLPVTSTARLSGSKVIWHCPDYLDIFIYDHVDGITTKLTNDDLRDFYSRISGNNVAWITTEYDPVSGKLVNNIKMATYTGCIAPSEADMNDDCKIDATDLNNIAGEWLSEPDTPPGFEYTRLTYSQVSDVFPQISGNNIVWREDDYFRPQILLHNLDSQITTEIGSGAFPVISGSNVAWIRSDEIFFYDGTTVKQLTDNDYIDGEQNTWQSLLSICGSRLVWAAEPNNLDQEIFFYDGNNIHRLTDNDINDQLPKVSESLVVWQRSNYFSHDSDSEIYIYDGQNTLRLTNNNLADEWPQISGSNIVWQYYDGSDYEILLYNHDANSITQITNNNHDDILPVINGSCIAWSGFDGNDWEVFYYDGTNIRQVTDNDYNDSEGHYTPAPKMSISETGTKLVWTTLWELFPAPGVVTEIRFYDAELDSIIPIDNNRWDRHPDISGNNIVWIADLPFQDSFSYEIQMAEYSPCFNPPPEDVNGDCKINLADFTTLASEWLLCGLDDPALCW